MIQISAVIITHNEARNIRRCIESLQSVADEILVLDSYSDDDTASIVGEYVAVFEQRAFDNYAAQKNHAHTLCSHDYILSVDADEQLTEDLRNSIADAKRNGAHAAYQMNRRNWYRGSWIRFSGWYPDRKIRLFDRRRCRWEGEGPHEKLIVGSGSTGKLTGDLLHYPFRGAEEHRQSARKYAEMAAPVLSKRATGHLWSKWLFSPPYRFFQCYFLKLGFLDGWRGLQICLISAHEVWLKYSMALSLKRKGNR